MLGAAIKSALGFRRSAVRPVARACSGVRSTVKAAGGGGALPCAAERTAARSELFVTRSALCGPYDFGPAADDIEESFRKLGAGVTGAAALPFSDSSDALARIKPAGLLGTHVSVRRMSTGSAGATGASEDAAVAAAGEDAASAEAAAVPETTSGDNSEAPPPPKACAPPTAVLVKAGDNGRWTSFKQGGLMGMDRAGLLRSLKADDVFAHKLKEVDLSDCSVELFELPASADEPSAADEALDKVKELKGAKIVGAMWSTIATADAAQLCIRVRLPADAAAAPSGLNGTDAHTLLQPAAPAVTLLDVSSAKALLASLRALMPAHALRKGTQLLQPRTLTITPFLSGTSVQEASESVDAAREFLHDVEPVRGATAKAISDAFTTRMTKRAKAGSNPKERQANPLVALQSAPGGGKSAMLDTLALMSSKGLWAPEHCPDDGMRAILNGSVPVPITYNSGSEVDLDSYDANISTGLAVRILHSFFIDSAVMAIDQFWALFPKGLPEGAALTAVTAVRACLLAAEQETGTKRGVLLLVDEIAKLLHRKPDAALLTTLCGLLDTLHSDEFNLVCTTLDSVMFKAKLTGSGRSIEWAPLPALTVAEAETLMLRALQRADATAAALPPEVRITISDAAGHPRSLQFVLEAMLAVAAAGKEGDKPADGRLRLQVLRDEALKRFRASNNLPTPSFEAVQAALRGVALSQKSTPLGDDRTLRALIADGVFINTNVDDEEITDLVPKLSMLRLLQFARAHATSATPLWSATAKAINVLADYEAQGAADANGPTLKSGHFERFMAQWLGLMALVRAGERLSVLQLFHAEHLAPADPAVGVPATAAVGTPAGRTDAAPAASAALTTTFALDGVALQKALPHRFAKALPPSQDLSRAAAGMIVQFGGNNPAFDILLTAPCDTAAGAFMAVLLEARKSDVGSGTVDGDQALRKKLDLLNGVAGKKGAAAKGGVRSLFNRMQPAPAHVAYVYAAARPVRDVAARQLELFKQGVLLLGNARPGEAASHATVKRALTETLYDRGFFMLDLTERLQ